ncbi:hypothetical protein [Streptomyces sp. V4I2]|uniref:Mu transposase domain-containing protein n=1 Tax=Streptomyces sp. V4I2 TaxID=3042280 RepID=UPI003593EF88
MPKKPFAVAFSSMRRGDWDATISVHGVRYSVPHQLVDTRVRARFNGGELIVPAAAEDGPAEVVRHGRPAPGSPQSVPAGSARRMRSDWSTGSQGDLSRFSRGTAACSSLQWPASCRR